MKEKYINSKKESSKKSKSSSIFFESKTCDILLNTWRSIRDKNQNISPEEILQIIKKNYGNELEKANKDLSDYQKKIICLKK